MILIKLFEAPSDSNFPVGSMFSYRFHASPSFEIKCGTECEVKTMAVEWLQDNLFHVIKTSLGLGTSIFDVGSDLYNGATYLGWLGPSCADNSSLQMDNLGSTTSPVNSSFCPEPDVDVYWGSITLSLTQLPGFAFFGLISLLALFNKYYREACIFLTLALLLPYPLLLVGFQ